MRRRSLLELILLSPLLGTASFAQEIVPRPPQLTMFTIAGINSKTNAEALGALLAALVIEVLPVNLIVDPEMDSESTVQESAIWQLVQRYQKSFPGLVEVIVWCPDLGSSAPFQAARQASEVRTRLEGKLRAVNGGTITESPLFSIACKIPLNANSASATLAAGFRNVVALPEATSTITARLDRHGVLSLIGGELTGLADVIETLRREKEGLYRHLILSGSEISAFDANDIFRHTREIGEFLRKATLDMSLLSVLLSNVQMWTDIKFRRRIAIVLLAPTHTNAGTIGDDTVFQQSLVRAGIPFSVAMVAEGINIDAFDDLAIRVPLGIPENGAFTPEAVYTVPMDTTLLTRHAIVSSQTGITFEVVVRAAQSAGTVGLSPNAELKFPVISVLGQTGGSYSAEELIEETKSDGIVFVSIPGLQEDADRNHALRVLRHLGSRADIHLVSLPKYCAEVLPKDELLPILLLTEASIRRRPESRSAVGPDEPTELMDDAHAAWEYFAQSTQSSTGLCPATATIGTRLNDGHVSVSMWEVGSHINAILAAVDLQLITDEDFSERCNMILRSVERASRKRLTLPAETLDIYSGKGTTRFNSFDTGRLLISLHRLKQHRLSPPGLAALVSSWDFASVIQNRRLHSYRDREMIDDFASNYSDYAATGMRLWGMDVASPFDEYARLVGGDRGAAVLGRAVSFGPVGCEPSYLHLLETAPSDAATYLADCLNGLQMMLAEEMGLSVAPSETPMDRSPWFTYQGFDFRKMSDPWVVEFAGKDEGAATEFDANSLRASSTKAAYLWHALYPNKHSAELVRTMRRKARSKFGFFSALYLDNQSPTEGHLDLNTNGVILQSIAFIQKGHG